MFPGIELMRTLMGAKAAKYLKNILHASNAVLQLDSEIALHWIKSIAKKMTGLNHKLNFQNTLKDRFLVHGDIAKENFIWQI